MFACVLCKNLINHTMRVPSKFVCMFNHQAYSTNIDEILYGGIFRKLYSCIGDFIPVHVGPVYRLFYTKTKSLPNYTLQFIGHLGLQLWSILNETCKSDSVRYVICSVIMCATTRICNKCTSKSMDEWP